MAAALGCVVSAPAIAQSADTSGIKAGVVVGYDKTEIGYAGETGNKDGFVYGATVGYDANLGATVIGVEAEISGSTTKEEVGDVFDEGDRLRLASGRDLYIGARLGARLAPSALFYVKGGYTNAAAELSFDSVEESVLPSFSESDRLDGFRIGGGVEFEVAGNGFARVEYRYSNYGEYRYEGFETGLTASRHQVVLTSGFLF